jgi:hypothetical protein
LYRSSEALEGEWRVFFFYDGLLNDLAIDVDHLFLGSAN